MKKLWIFGMVAISFAVLFWACGDGSIDPLAGDDELALLNYGEFNPEGMKGLVNEAMAKCEEDPACKQAMDNSKDITPPAGSDSSTAADSSAKDSSATSSSAAGNSSANGSTVSSSGTGTSSSSQSQTGSSSSASVITSSSKIEPTSFKGTCAPTPAAVIKGNGTSWSYTNFSNVCSNKYNCFLEPETYEWSFEGAETETSTEATPSNIVYATVGTYAPKLKVKNGDVDTLLTCTAVEVQGPEITDCECSGPTYSPASGDLKDGNPVTATWTVSGCKSVDGKGVEETEFTYTWSGTGVTGSSTTGTGTYTELGIYTASVEVSKYGKTTKVECPKASIYMNGWNFRCSDSNLKKSLTVTERSCNGSTCYETDDSGDLLPNDCVKVSKGKTGTFVFGSWWCDGGPFTAHIRDCSGNEQVIEHDCSGWVQIPTITEACDIYFYVTGVNKYTSKYGVW